MWCSLGGIEKARVFIDPERCLHCYLETRASLGVGRERALEILSRNPSRTKAFVESFSLSKRDFSRVKESLNEAALRLLEESRLWESISDPLDWLALAAAANSIDSWMPWGAHSSSVKLVKWRPPSRVREEVAKLLRDASDVVFLLDNAGEAVIDVALALSLASEGRKVYLVAKSLPYETDVTVGEVEAIIGRVSRLLGVEARLEVAGTGSRYPAPAVAALGGLSMVRGAELVVSKGIANYEALIEYCSIDPSRTVIALTAKCPVLAEKFGVGLGDPVLRRGYECRGGNGGG